MRAITLIDINVNAYYSSCNFMPEKSSITDCVGKKSPLIMSPMDVHTFKNKTKRCDFTLSESFQITCCPSGNTGVPCNAPALVCRVPCPAVPGSAFPFHTDVERAPPAETEHPIFCLYAFLEYSSNISK